MKKYMLLILVSALSFAFFSWKTDTKELQTEKNVQAFSNSENNEAEGNGFEKWYPYTEMACAVDRRTMGTLCGSGNGHCKKQRGCIAIKTPSIILTPAEIKFYAGQYAHEMLDNGYIDEETFGESKELAIQVLEANQEEAENPQP